jgi:SAM-dependent methyltransferase
LAFSSPDWVKRFFRGSIFSPGEPSALAQAPAEARFAARALGLRKGDRLLDVCCGVGRHSFLLASRGAQVTGIDVTEEYLRQARRRAGARRNPAFLKADIRRLPFTGSFDAAICLWTSFGYFAAPAQDVAALGQIYKALRPGGLFLVDVLNAGWLRGHFQPRQWRPGANGAMVLEESAILPGPDPRLKSSWLVIGPGKPWRKAELVIRLYDKRRLAAALRKAGFSVSRCWGALAERKFSMKSSRLVILAKRPH